MQFQCACGKQYNIPDAVLKKPVTRTTCAQCGQRIIIEHPEMAALRVQNTAPTPTPVMAPPVIVAAAPSGMVPAIAAVPPLTAAPAQTPPPPHAVAHTPPPPVRSTSPSLPSYPQPRPVSAPQANVSPPPALRTAPPPLPASSPAARQPSPRPTPPARAPEPEPSLTLEPDPPVVPDGMVLIEGLSLRSDHGYGVVRIEAFLIDAFAVTNADYARYVEATDALPPHTWNGRTPPAHLAQHPVVGVSRLDAERYAAWRGCRLPTPLEWEAAARSPDGRHFPWGVTWDPARQHGPQSTTRSTVPVDAYPEGRSRAGCFGLVGNVWEWTTDDPRTEADPGYAWVFGGSFMHEGQRQGRIARTSVSVENAYHYLGFRCARDLDP